MGLPLTDPDWPADRDPDPARLEARGSGAGGRRYWLLHQPGPWGASLFVKDCGPGRSAGEVAQREFQNARRLREARAPCVRPWAAWRLRGRACLLLEDLGPEASLDRASLLALPEGLAAAARAAAALHRAGALHGDLHLGNLLRARDGTLHWTDLARLRFPRRLERQDRIRDLGRLIADLLPLSAADLRVFAAAYGEGSDPGFGLAIEEAGYERLRTHHGNLDRRARREAHGPHPVLWRIPPQALDSFPERGILKEGKRSRVMRTRLADGSPAVLKHYLPSRRIDPRDRLGRGKALRCLFLAEGLLRRGLRAARPLGAWSLPGRGSWLLLEDLPQHRPLDRVLLTLSPSAREELLQTVAHLLHHMHRLGVAYRDLKPSNLLVAPEAATPDRLCLVDHDRNRLGTQEVPPALAIRDLAALHAGLPPLLRASERMRALASYDPLLAIRPNWELLIRPLLEEAAARQHRWIPRRLLGGPRG